MSLVEYARKEFTNFKGIEPYGDELNVHVLELIRLFAKAEHSGGSAYSALVLFNRLASFKPLTPLTGEKDEWKDIRPYGGSSSFQNRRWFKVFKDSEDGEAYYYDNKDKRQVVTFPFRVP